MHSRNPVLAVRSYHYRSRCMCSDSIGGKLLSGFEAAASVGDNALLYGQEGLFLYEWWYLYRFLANISSNNSWGLKEASTQQQHFRSTQHWVQWQKIMWSKRLSYQSTFKYSEIKILFIQEQEYWGLWHQGVERNSCRQNKPFCEINQGIFRKADLSWVGSTWILSTLSVC